jgi:hypothetical protein
VIVGLRSRVGEGFLWVANGSRTQAATIFRPGVDSYAFTEALIGLLAKLLGSSNQSDWTCDGFKGAR